jgi:hypothetical protein
MECNEGEMMDRTARTTKRTANSRRLGPGNLYCDGEFLGLVNWVEFQPMGLRDLKVVERQMRADEVYADRMRAIVMTQAAVIIVLLLVVLFG